MRTYWIADNVRDDLDTMNDPGRYLDEGGIGAEEEGFIRGFNAAA